MDKRESILETIGIMKKLNKKSKFTIEFDDDISKFENMDEFKWDLQIGIEDLIHNKYMDGEISEEFTFTVREAK